MKYQRVEERIEFMIILLHIKESVIVSQYTNFLLILASRKLSILDMKKSKPNRMPSSLDKELGVAHCLGNECIQIGDTDLEN